MLLTNHCMSILASSCGSTGGRPASFPVCIVNRCTRPSLPQVKGGLRWHTDKKAHLHPPAPILQGSQLPHTKSIKEWSDILVRYYEVPNVLCWFSGQNGVNLIPI
jgi:hypothetical protein